MSRRRGLIGVSVGGRLPAGYQEVEYLESTGTQYIDTGISPYSEIEIEAECIFTQVASLNMVYGISSGWKANEFSFGWNITKPFVGYGAYWSAPGDYWANPPTLDTGINYKIVNSYAGCVVYKDGGYLGIAMAEQNKYLFNTLNTIYIFAKPLMSGFGLLKLYSLTIRNHDTTVQDANFVPCLRIADNKPGMYDLCGSICPLTGTPFYINAGTGEFIAGNPV